jgi:NAD(P)-dependent dehydrogenase (short-subunit alcohol dehydrogenase family)
MVDLAGTRVLVTGGTSVLGRAMAEALVKAGARVAITSRDGSRADAIAAQLGPSATGLQLDVRDEPSVQSGLDEADALGGWMSWSTTRASACGASAAVHDESAAVLGGPAGWLQMPWLEAANLDSSV